MPVTGTMHQELTEDDLRTIASRTITRALDQVFHLRKTMLVGLLLGAMVAIGAGRAAATGELDARAWVGCVMAALVAVICGVGFWRLPKAPACWARAFAAAWVVATVVATVLAATSSMGVPAAFGALVLLGPGAAWAFLVAGILGRAAAMARRYPDLRASHAFFDLPQRRIGWRRRAPRRTD